MRFQTKNGVLIAQVNGETLRIEPWGKDSLRVRATMLPEFRKRLGADRSAGKNRGKSRAV